jgi:glycerol uptake facilitator-like aquaporin
MSDNTKEPAANSTEAFVNIREDTEINLAPDADTPDLVSKDTLLVIILDAYPSIAELIGTLFFVFLGLTAVQSALTLGSNNTLQANLESSDFVLLIAASFGISLMVCISMVAKVSGGHLNPAVTIALCASGIVSIPKAAMYIVAQTAGATIGAAFANLVTPGPLLGTNAVSSNVDVNIAFWSEVLLTFVLVLTVFTTAVDKTEMNSGFAPFYIGFSVFAIHLSGITIDGSSNVDVNIAFWSEVLLTFVLVLTVFTTAVDKTEMNSGFAPFYIGFSVFAIHLSGITIDGTSVNPARSFAAAAVAGKWADQWIFWVGPILGGLLAAGVFRFFQYVHTQKIKLE